MTQTMVPVADLLRNIDDSVDFGEMENAEKWHAWIADKAYDPQFWALVDSITENGFNVPVCIGVTGYRGWLMGNGHHRVAAAILLCLDEIPVVFSYRDYTGYDEDDEDAGWIDTMRLDETTGRDDPVYTGEIDYVPWGGWATVDETLWQHLTDRL